MLSQWGSPTGEVLLDDGVIGEFSGVGTPDRPATETFQITGTGALQALTIRPRAGAGGYVHVDALALAAEGPVEILDPDGRPALMLSRALPPPEAETVRAAMAPKANLAILGDAMRYQATEEFATAIDGTRTYSPAAALDGDPESSYWAGASPPPHALVLTWKEPVRLTHNRIVWLGENRGIWYGLEYWNGTRWQLLYEEPRNLQREPVYEFAPVTTTSVRFTAYTLTGQQRVLMSAFELYNLPGKGEAQ
jgi:hypothetical protein